jgi:hypothetical protein
MTIEQGEEVPVIAEPMTTVALDQILLDAGMIVNGRTAAQAETPLTNGHARDITGVDEVAVNRDNKLTTIFQCLYCGEFGFANALSGRSHLVRHSDKAQTVSRDAQTVAEAVLNGKSIYAPYDTDEANVTFMKRVMEENTSALTRVLRNSKANSRQNGKAQVPADVLKTLELKAKAYDDIKAEALEAAKRFKI